MSIDLLYMSMAPIMLMALLKKHLLDKYLFYFSE